MANVVKFLKSLNSMSHKSSKPNRIWGEGKWGGHLNEGWVYKGVK